MVFTSTKFEGFYPVGVAAVVIADDHDEAARILNKKLGESGLAKNSAMPCDMELLTDEKQAVILCDGNY